MRYAGLAIGDAVRCRKDAINKDTLTLYRTKSGELVIVPLPKLVLQSLAAIHSDTDYFFWTGSALSISATKYWRTRLNRVGHRAGIDDFRPHRLRDTFAVELLLANVAMQDVSALLGHSGISTTERYYAPWNTVRRDRLVHVVKEVNDADGMLRKLTARLLKEKTGAVRPAPVSKPDNAPPDDE